MRDMVERIPPLARDILRVIIGLALAGASVVGGLITWFVGTIEITGCFMTCEEPNRLGGLALLALTVGLGGLAGASLVWAVSGFRRHVLFVGFALGCALAFVLSVLGVSIQ